MKVLVLGATGMLGSAMMRSMSESNRLTTFGSIRSEESKPRFVPAIAERLIVSPDLLDPHALSDLLSAVRPDVVINCVSPNRDSLRSGDPLRIIPVCALFPHQLAGQCLEIGARLVHISTDGVFSGAKGAYTEDDAPDATDVYGVSKRLGEPHASHVFVLRTSMIGHELSTTEGLLEWVLSQRHTCKCFERAVFSGLPTIVLAEIVRDYVLPRPELAGVYHVAAQPISKCELLRLVARAYGKQIEIVPDDGPAMDRSLDAGRFRAATGYVAPDWPMLVQTMHSLR